MEGSNFEQATEPTNAHISPCDDPPHDPDREKTWSKKGAEDCR